MIVVGVGLLLVSFGLMVVEVKAQRKRRRIIEYQNFVKRELATGEVLGDSAIFASGTAGYTLLDFYHEAVNHADVLDILEQRYPEEMGAATPLDWLQKIEHLEHKGPKSVGTYVSGYAGEKSEHLAAATLDQQGLHAEQFASKTHPNDDLHAQNPDGSFTDYSVKSYSSVSDFKNVVAEHPQSTHYVVNHDLYEKLIVDHQIEAYQNQGITIVDGGYNNAVLRDQADGTFHDLHHATDVGHHIPMIGLGIFVIKGAFNVRQFTKGNQSKHELTANIVSDGTRVGAASGSGFGMAKLGGLIGTAVNPGIGTLVGATVGVFIGAFGVGHFFKAMKTNLKWGKIIKAQSQLGKLYFQGRLSQSFRPLLNQIFDYEASRNRIETEKKQSFKYQDQLNPYKSERVSVSAVLNKLYSDYLTGYVKMNELTLQKTKGKLESICTEVAEKLNENKSKKNIQTMKEQYMGELLLSSKELVFTEQEQSQWTELFDNYDRQKGKNPHYPIRFASDPKDLVKNKAIESFQDIHNQTPKLPTGEIKPISWLMWTVIVVLALAGIGSMGTVLLLPF